jgi:hypothetical protein
MVEYMPNMLMEGEQAIANITSAQDIHSILDKNVVYSPTPDNSEFSIDGWGTCAFLQSWQNGRAFLNCDILYDVFPQYGLTTNAIDSWIQNCPTTCFNDSSILKAYNTITKTENESSWLKNYQYIRSVPVSQSLYGGRRLSETPCLDCDAATFYDDITGMRLSFVEDPCDEYFSIAQVKSVLSDGFIARETTINRGTFIYKINNRRFVNLDDFFAPDGFDLYKTQCLESGNSTESCKGSKAFMTIGKLENGCIVEDETIEVRRGPVYDDALSYTTTFDKKMYIKFERFSWTKLLRDTFYDLTIRDDIEEVVIDLRDNTGGFLRTANRIAYALGMDIRLLKLKIGKYTSDYLVQGIEDRPLGQIFPIGFVNRSNALNITFLVNEDTASASEVLILTTFANIHKNVRIIGSERTVGKFYVNIVEEINLYNSGIILQNFILTSVFSIDEKFTELYDYYIAYSPNDDPVGILPTDLIPEVESSNTAPNILPYEEDPVYKYAMKGIPLYKRRQLHSSPRSTGTTRHGKGFLIENEPSTDIFHDIQNIA